MNVEKKVFSLYYFDNDTSIKMSMKMATFYFDFIIGQVLKLFRISK